MVVPASFLAVAGLVVVHLFSGKLRFLGGTPRSVWLSVGGGVSVAYVFVHLLPELAESQETIAGAVGEELAFLEYHVYLVSLLGLVFFYGLEQTARGSRGRKAGRGDSTGQGIFWLHISSFAVYNAIIGYLLLHRLDSGLENLLLFSVAMALHFVVNDYGLRAHHTGAYARVGRWVISAAIVLGWVIGLLAEVPEAAIAALTAFLAGARS
ncbi:hypothetical protein BH24ACT19_BH24ACT19_16230 [soil metagenome]